MVNPEKPSSEDSEQWQPCPPGELVKFAGRLRSKHRLHRIVQLASVCAVLLLAAGTIYLQWEPRQHSTIPEGRIPDRGEYNYGGITCTEIHQVLPRLKEGTLDDDTLARVREHIEQCPQCKAFARFLENPVETGQGSRDASLGTPRLASVCRTEVRWPGATGCVRW